MKIYTKTGDKGITSLTGGKRIAKNDIQVESYGCVDELNSFIGLILSQDIDENEMMVLIDIQRSLFRIGAYLSTDYSGKNTVCELKSKDIAIIEKQIDLISAELKPLKNFILPNGNQLISYCHVSRAVCRRAERAIITMNDLQKMDKNIIIYLNRLSDYLFVLSRKFSKDFGLEETVV
jgi:cob(I)alamin adenosyltransferase